jgi:hypothetical protein
MQVCYSIKWFNRSVRMRLLNASPGSGSFFGE